LTHFPIPPSIEATSSAGANRAGRATTSRNRAGGLCAQKAQVAGLGEIACWYNAKHRELQMLRGGTLMTIEITRSATRPTR
jgi:hypothetical protein